MECGFSPSIYLYRYRRASCHCERCFHPSPRVVHYQYMRLPRFPLSMHRNLRLPRFPLSVHRNLRLPRFPLSVHRNLRLPRFPLPLHRTLHSARFPLRRDRARVPMAFPPTATFPYACSELRRHYGV
jgi:hypothetical protein